jgi:hypothetical protein
VKVMQHMHFHAKSVKNDLKPTNFLKRNFCFEMEGVQSDSSLLRFQVVLEHAKRLRPCYKNPTFKLVILGLVGPPKFVVFWVLLQLNFQYVPKINK